MSELKFRKVNSHCIRCRLCMRVFPNDKNHTAYKKHLIMKHGEKY